MSCLDCKYYVKGFDRSLGYEYNGCNYPDHEWENFPPWGCEDKNKPYIKKKKYSTARRPVCRQCEFYDFNESYEFCCTAKNYKPIKLDRKHRPDWCPRLEMKYE